MRPALVHLTPPRSLVKKIDRWLASKGKRWTFHDLSAVRVLLGADLLGAERGVSAGVWGGRCGGVEWGGVEEGLAEWGVGV